MIPKLLPPDVAVKKGGTGRQRVTGKVPRVFASSDANKTDRATWLGQFGHAGKAGAGVEVMEGSDRHHQVKGLGLKRVAKEVAQHIADVRRVGVCLSLDDARRIKIDTDHFLRRLGELAGQRAAATTNVQDSVGGPEVQQERVVMDIAVPTL